MRTRVQAKLQAVKTELRQRMHRPVPELGAYVRAVVQGHMQYYAVPLNSPSVFAFARAIGRLWWQTLFVGVNAASRGRVCAATSSAGFLRSTSVIRIRLTGFAS